VWDLSRESVGGWRRVGPVLQYFIRESGQKKNKVLYVGDLLYQLGGKENSRSSSYKGEGVGDDQDVWPSLLSLD